MAPASNCKLLFLKGKEIAQEFGSPFGIRASYTLGGSRCSLVYDHKAEDFDELLMTRGLEVISYS